MPSRRKTWDCKTSLGRARKARLCTQEKRERRSGEDKMIIVYEYDRQLDYWDWFIVKNHISQVRPRGISACVWFVPGTES